MGNELDQEPSLSQIKSRSEVAEFQNDLQESLTIPRQSSLRKSLENPKVQSTGKLESLRQLRMSLEDKLQAK